MPELVVDFITSLDGYASAEGWPGRWGLEGPEYLAWLGEQPERDYTILMGANTYRLMYGFAAQFEATDEPMGDEGAAITELASMDKVVFSSTLEAPLEWATRLERQLDAQLVDESKAASRGDLTIGGPTLAAEALRLDLVDVVELLWCPVLLGGGIPVLSAGVRRDLRLRRERRFRNGVVQAAYDVIEHVKP